MRKWLGSVSRGFGVWLALALFVCVNALSVGVRAQDAPAPAPLIGASNGAASADKAETADPLPAPVSRALSQHAATLERLQKAVERVRADDIELEAQRIEIEKLIADVQATRTELAPLLDTIDKQIAELGPVPKEGEPAEAPELQEERTSLNTAHAKIVAAQKGADLLVLRSQQLIQRIQDYRLENFTKNILERSDSPATGKLWRAVYAALPRLATQLTTLADNWWATARSQIGAISLMLVLGLLLYIALLLVRRNVIARVLTEPHEPRPSFLRRVITTTWLVPVIAMPGAATALFIFLVGDALAIWEGDIRSFTITALIAFLVFSLVTALTTGVLQPRRPSWRLIGIPTPIARRLLWATNAMAGIYAGDLFLHHTIQLFHMPVPIRVLETSIANLAFAAVLVVFALTMLPEGMNRLSGRMVKTGLNWLRFPLLLVAILIIAATVLGYVSLGRFIAGQMMLMGAGSAAVLLVHLAIRAATAAPDKTVDVVGDDSRVWWALRRQQVADGIAIMLNAVLAAAALLLLLLSWGIPLSQLLGAMKALFFGFEIGQVRISLFRILIGIGLFTFVVFATRLVQRWLQRSVLSSSKIDVGIANSLQTGIGYLGIGLAAVVGLSYAGIDFTQLTLVIGALSLGVGLGLQSIVNNFVSGLILLVERPVKVGDWVVIGEQQGFVRKISVRATEIETFDRASVIIPNSALISGVVQNWTHRNAMGRVVVNVGVAYGCDPEEVIETLISVAKDSDAILGFPAPFVSFDEFGASSLDFSLRCYVADVTTSLAAKTALRTEILKRFREKGIEIPFPQQDIHLRDLDGLRGFITRAIEQRERERAGQAPTVDVHDRSGDPETGGEPGRS
jgi:potassium efflux system protein